MAKNEKNSKKIVDVDGYWRTSYGKRHFVKKHKRGHHRSFHLPGDPSRYQAGNRICKYDSGKDLARYAPNRRKKGKARWRGDYLKSRL